MKTISAIACLLTLSACSPCMQHPATSMVSHDGLSCSAAKVSGMTCEACASTMSANLKKVAGVKDVGVDVASGTVKIYTDAKHKPSAAAVKSVVERSGYTFQSLQPTCSN